MPPFALHFAEHDVDAVLARIAPERLRALRLGVACAGYQCEGGFNGPGEPRNNWGDWEGRPGVAASGPACRFWERYEEDARIASGAGLTAFRLSLEWARIERSTGGALEPAAIDHYAQMLAALAHAGLEPLVTLYHWTHPAFLGPDFWLEDGAPARFAAYLRAMLPPLLDALERLGAPPPRRFVTLNEPNMFVLATYLVGRFPHGRGREGGRNGRRCMEQQLLAHLEAVRAVREVYRARGLPPPRLSFNDNFWAIYQAGLLFLDLLLAPRNRVPRAALPDHLRAREAELARAFLTTEPAPSILARAARLAVRGSAPLLRQAVDASRLARLVDAAYAFDAEPLDFVAFDYYDPFPWNLLGRSTPGNGRGPGPVIDEWDWRPHPRGLSAALQLYAQSAPGLPVWIAENGMATRSVDGRACPRRDGARRAAFIQAHLYELLRALAGGVPVEGYLHWSLWDNYEWGSYQPRFGLTGPARGALDAAGAPSLAAYAAIARAAGGGDRAALTRALTARSA